MSKVPFIICSADIKKLKGQGNGNNCSDDQFGKLCDIAPTILELLKIEKPKEMTGQTLII
jgi:bisphosphoglycerate-independent phosphoglycerate mutase (AlkP superfamily)